MKTVAIDPRKTMIGLWLIAVGMFMQVGMAPFGMLVMAGSAFYVFGVVRGDGVSRWLAYGSASLFTVGTALGFAEPMVAHHAGRLPSGFSLAFLNYAGLIAVMGMATGLALLCIMMRRLCNLAAWHKGKTLWGWAAVLMTLMITATPVVFLFGAPVDELVASAARHIGGLLVLLAHVSMLAGPISYVVAVIGTQIGASTASVAGVEGSPLRTDFEEEG